MIQIGRHIEILLLSNDCVIVPGLGGFVTHKIDARYDKDDCIFLPPIRTLGFNPQLQLNDSLLVISYVEAFDISYPEALRMIEAEVEELKQILATEGSYEMNGIGTLHLNKEGAVVFEPCEAGVLTPDLYALSSFDFAYLPVISQPAKAVPEPAVIRTEPAALTSNTVEDALTADNIVPDSDNNDDDSNYIHISTTWLKAAVAAAAVLLFAIVLISPNETVNGYCRHMTTWSTELIQKLIPKDTNIETVKIQPQIMPVKAVKKAKSAAAVNNRPEKASLNDQAINNDSKTAENKTIESDTNIKADSAKSKPAKTIEDCYTIVLASSITETNAKVYIQALKNKGYNDAAIYNNGHMIRVVYGNFGSMQNAQDSLRKLRDSKDFEEAWVLKIQN